MSISEDNVSCVLNCLFEQVLVFWREHLKTEGYMIYIRTEDISDLSYAYVYGWQENHALLHGLQDYRSVEEIYSVIFNQSQHYVTKVAVFNREKVYFYEVRNDTKGLYISIGMSSIIFGRSNIHIADIICKDVINEWEISASRYARGSKFHGYKGTLKMCMWHIMENEAQSDCPFSPMTRAFSFEYHDAMRRQFVIKLSPDGIRFNDYFEI